MLSNRAQKSLAVTIIIISGLCWFLFGWPKWNTIFSSVESGKSLSTKIDLPPLDAPMETLAQPISSTQSEENITFEHNLKNCYPHLEGHIHSSTEFVAHWQSLYPQSKQDLDFFRYFFKDKKGNEIRAHILYTVQNSRPIRELKIFKVLEDGLPDLVEINTNDRYNPSDTTLSKYIDFHTVFETQKKWSSTANEFSIEVEEANEQVIEFQAFQKDQTFRCHENECECLKKP